MVQIMSCNVHCFIFSASHVISVKESRFCSMITSRFLVVMTLLSTMCDSCLILTSSVVRSGSGESIGWSLHQRTTSSQSDTDAHHWNGVTWRTCLRHQSHVACVTRLRQQNSAEIPGVCFAGISYVLTSVFCIILRCKQSLFLDWYKHIDAYCVLKWWKTNHFRRLAASSQAWPVLVQLMMTSCRLRYRIRSENTAKTMVI